MVCCRCWKRGVADGLQQHLCDPCFQEQGEVLVESSQYNISMILARQSNFARALYPAVRHAVDSGVLNADM